MTVIEILVLCVATIAAISGCLIGLKLMADFTALNAALAANTQAVQAAVQKIEALPTDTDQASVDAVATQIEANTAALVAVAPVQG